MTAVEPKVILIPESIQLSDVPDKEYFSDKYAAYTSNSRLGLINPKQQGSPEKYLKGFDDSFNPSFILGDAIHKLILQPKEYILIEELNKPSGKMGLVADFISKKFTETNNFEEAVKYGIIEAGYYGGKLTENNIKKVSEACLEYIINKSKFVFEDKESIFLDERSRFTVKTCVDNVKNNQLIQQILTENGLFNTVNLCEECVTAKFKVILGGKEEIICFKGKVDHYSFIDDYLLQVNDLKSTGRTVEQFGEHSFNNYHYYRQMAIYTWLLRNYYAQRYDNITVNNPKMLLVSTIPPNECGVYEVSKDDIRKGLAEFKDLICRVAICEIFGYETIVLEDYVKGNFDSYFLG